MIKLIQLRQSTQVLKKIQAILMLLGAMLSVSAVADGVKPAWYRYYDQNGVANLSTTVSPNHIRYGYESLDRNMQVLQRTRPFNSEKAAHATKPTAYSQQRELDRRLKSAYGSSQVASQKRQEKLKHITQQIELQKKQLQQLEKDRVGFKKQALAFTQKGRAIPKNLQDTLNYNQQYLQNGQKQLQTLQVQYQKTQVEYDKIIARLKTLE